MFSTDEPRIGFILGTGPSLTQQQIEAIAPYRKFGANLTYRLGVDVALGCNWQFWDTYYSDAVKHGGMLWTTRKESAEKYEKLNYIEERWEPGLSVDQNYVCAHHGSGPQVLNLAYHYGVRVFCLLGWDMRYPGKVTDRRYNGLRHYFGEYPKHLQHWPKTGDNGEFTGLIKEMETIRPKDYGIKIINCTEGSALKCFPMMSLSRFLSEYQNDLEWYTG